MVSDIFSFLSDTLAFSIVLVVKGGQGKMSKSLLRTDKEIAEIYKRHSKTVYRVCFAYMKNPADTEDAVQDMFIHFWENRIKLQVKDSLRAYFYTCIRHRALKNLQKQAIVRKHNPKLTEFIEYLLHSEYSVEEEQEIERIKVIMQELPPQCLKVFMLSAIEEKKYTEIADELSISVNTVKTHISKAYRLIRGQLHSEESLILWYWLMSQSTCLKSEMNIRL